MRAVALIAAVVALLGGGSLMSGCGEDTPTTPSPTTPTSPTTSTFSSQLMVKGAVSRLFTATAGGTVSVTLNSAGAAGTIVGLGLGVPSSGIARCTLTTAIVTAAGSAPQIAAAVDEGSYCVAVYDVGTLTDAIPFNLTIVYP